MTHWNLMSDPARPPHLADCLVTIEFKLQHKQHVHIRRETWCAFYVNGRGFVLACAEGTGKGLKTAEQMGIQATTIAWALRPEPYAEEDLLA
jgi:hypothetical protein